MQTIEVTDQEFAYIQQVRMTPEQWTAQVEQMRQQAAEAMTTDQRAQYDAYMALPVNTRTALDLARSFGPTVDQLVALMASGTDLMYVFGLLTPEEQSKILQLAAILPHA